MKPCIPFMHPHVQLQERRRFIRNMLKASLASAFVLSGVKPALGFSRRQAYTVGDIMDMVIKAVPRAAFAETVDTLKAGSREMAVSGIVTTMFATIEVIHRAIQEGANFIIAHEPTFYNHADDKNWVVPNAITAQKLELLEKNRIAVWRLHDYLHSFVPDSVRYGVVKSAGWLPYYTSGSNTIKIPAMQLGDLVAHLKQKLAIKHLRVIGSLSQSCEHIALLPGAAGGQRHITLVEKEHPDVLVVGEVHEWETAEYIRDLQALGGKTALIILGHSVSEEPGLQWLQEWLQSKTTGIAIHHIASGDPFTWI